MTDHITRRSALAMTSAALVASCVDNKAVSGPGTLPLGSLPTGQWSTGTPLPFPVQEIYPCAHNGALHLAGGFIAKDGRISGPTAEHNSWSSTLNSWRSQRPLPASRHHPHLISFKSSLMALGGFESISGEAAWVMQANGWVGLPDLVCVHGSRCRINRETGASAGCRRPPCDYSPLEQMQPLPAPCAEAVVGVLGDGALHLAGGRTPNGEANAAWTDHGDTNNHFVLTGLTDTWQRAAPCLTKRNSAAGDVIDGNLHVVGGRTVIERQNVATHEVYDHREDKWRTAAPMPQAQGGLAAAAVGGKLYAFGGEYFDNGGGVYKEAWAYDPATDAWIALPDMPNPRHGLGAVALDGKIYVIGGALQASGVETSALVEVFTPN